MTRRSGICVTGILIDLTTESELINFQLSLQTDPWVCSEYLCETMLLENEHSCERFDYESDCKRFMSVEEFEEELIMLIAGVQELVKAHPC